MWCCCAAALLRLHYGTVFFLSRHIAKTFSASQPAHGAGAVGLEDACKFTDHILDALQFKTAGAADSGLAAATTSLADAVHASCLDAGAAASLAFAVQPVRQRGLV